jgi:hypothetical protein
MAKKEELIVTAESLGINTEGLTVAQLEEAIAAKNAEGAKTLQEQVDEAQADADAKKVVFEEAQAIADALKSDLGIEAVTEAKTKELADAFELDGKFYGLSALTPKTLKVLDDVYTQKELLQNKEAMEFLIIGNSCFIKRLK